MKTTRLFLGRGLWAAAILACAGPLAHAASTAAAAIDPATGEEVVKGVITAVSSDQLTVDNSKVIAISATTACIRDGQTMMLSDLTVGDRVSVKAFHDPATGRRQAVLIEVVARTGVGGTEPGAGY